MRGIIALSALLILTQIPSICLMSKNLLNIRLEGLNKSQNQLMIFIPDLTFQ